MQRNDIAQQYQHQIACLNKLKSYQVVLANRRNELSVEIDNIDESSPGRIEIEAIKATLLRIDECAATIIANLNSVTEETINGINLLILSGLSQEHQTDDALRIINNIEVLTSNYMQDNYAELLDDTIQALLYIEYLTELKLYESALYVTFELPIAQMLIVTIKQLLDDAVTDLTQIESSAVDIGSLLFIGASDPYIAEQIVKIEQKKSSFSDSPAVRSATRQCMIDLMNSEPAKITQIHVNSLGNNQENVLVTTSGQNFRSLSFFPSLSRRLPKNFLCNVFSSPSLQAGKSYFHIHAVSAGALFSFQTLLAMLRFLESYYSSDCTINLMKPPVIRAFYFKISDLLRALKTENPDHEIIESTSGNLFQLGTLFHHRAPDFTAHDGEGNLFVGDMNGKVARSDFLSDEGDDQESQADKQRNTSDDIFEEGVSASVQAHSPFNLTRSN